MRPSINRARTEAAWVTGRPQAAEYHLLLRMILDKAKGARSFEADIAAFPGRLDLRRKARKREALIDMAAGDAKAARHLVGR
jgi:hypothetical protein